MKKAAVILAVLALILVMNLLGRRMNPDKDFYNEKGRVNNDPYIVYEIARQDSSARVILLGIVHSGRKEQYPLDLKLMNLFNESDYLVTERDLSRSFAGGEATDSFEKHTDAAGIKRVMDLAEAYGMDYAMLKDKDILAILNLFQTQAMVDTGFDYRYGLDIYFTQQAVKLKKPILEAEGVVYELDILKQVTQEQACTDTVIDLIPDTPLALRDEIVAAVDAMKSGDSEKFSQIIDMGQENESRFRELYWDARNAKMQETIEGYFDTDKAYFIAIGAGHVLGERGILASLKAKGFQVEQQE